MKDGGVVWRWGPPGITGLRYCVRGVNHLTLQTPILYSPTGLHLKLAKRAPKTGPRGPIVVAQGDQT